MSRCFFLYACDCSPYIYRASVLFDYASCSALLFFIIVFFNVAISSNTSLLSLFYHTMRSWAEGHIHSSDVSVETPSFSKTSLKPARCTQEPSKKETIFEHPSVRLQSLHNLFKSNCVKSIEGHLLCPLLLGGAKLCLRLVP